MPAQKHYDARDTARQHIITCSRILTRAIDNIRRLQIYCSDPPPIRPPIPQRLELIVFDLKAAKSHLHQADLNLVTSDQEPLPFT